MNTETDSRRKELSLGKRDIYTATTKPENPFLEQFEKELKRFTSTIGKASFNGMKRAAFEMLPREILLSRCWNLSHVDRGEEKAPAWWSGLFEVINNKNIIKAHHNFLHHNSDRMITIIKNRDSHHCPVGWVRSICSQFQIPFKQLPIPDIRTYNFLATKTQADVNWARWCSINRLRNADSSLCLVTSSIALRWSPTRNAITSMFTVFCPGAPSTRMRSYRMRSMCPTHF